VTKGRIQEQKKLESEFSWIDGVWNWFVSMRTGLWLLGLVAVLSVIGTLIPQEDLGPDANPIFKFLGFYDMYNAWWFRTVLGLLCMNIALCSLQRFPILWKNTFALPDMPQKETLRHFPLHGKSNSSADLGKVTNTITDELKKNGFRVMQYVGQPGTLYVDKGRWASWGTFVVHLSMLIIVIGALVGNFRGFSTVVSVPVGETYELTRQQFPIKQNFAIKVNDFKTQFYSQGGVADWISDISVVQMNNEILRQEVKVNHPLNFQGVRIYQSSYGQAIKTAVYDTAGQRILEGAVAEGELLHAGNSGLIVRPARYIPDFDPARPMVSKSPEPKNPKILYIVYDKGKELDWGAATPGETVRLKDKGSIVFENVIPYTGLQIKRDPGFPIVMIGFVLMTLGFFVSLYSRHIQLWFALSSQGNGTQIEWGGKTLRAHLEAEKITKIVTGVLPVAGRE
jgi:cytochrome c biogenesis protein